MRYRSVSSQAEVCAHVKHYDAFARLSRTAGGPAWETPTLMRCLSLDLEVVKRSGRIRAYAAVYADGRSMSRDGLRGSDISEALAELDEFARDADVVLGHNLILFDNAHLRAAAPELRLLGLPALDTLWLSPLAFPRHPYHHLVKHYQDGGLRRGQVNDPKLDATLTLELLDDECAALAQTKPELLAAWHWLTTAVGREHAFDLFFSQLRKADRPSAAHAHQAINRLLHGNACTTQANAVVADAAQQGWPLAYALAWLSVAGGNSVMPPWVRWQFPEAGKLVRALRDTACTAPDCVWCRERHDARSELKRWFRHEDFRKTPATETGDSMQQAIVESAMAGRHVLGLLPTGSGKSLCYQIPALSRYHKTGALTVVISPLVALMADQVAGLQSQGIGAAVTVNGMLSQPERVDALDRIRLGDAAIVLTSPEQLRNRSVANALKQREIGAWTLDEAHCLSSWGHDFRPDYRYVGRFIREHAGELAIPPVMCLTATAKPAVVEDIRRYFRDQLEVELQLFDGGAQRPNLAFHIVPTAPAEKPQHIDGLLADHLPEDGSGGAIVYCSTRRRCEEIAEFLKVKAWSADHFHAGLPPERKKVVQQDFIAGRLRVIVATNAFGMGVDKPDVRLVVHGDMPGSLENYLQEAGRAGRDAEAANCVLLYTQDDVERQFRMSARSRLTRREIDGICQALRNLAPGPRRRANAVRDVVATPGEILLADEEHAFQRDANTDDTRVKTAIAWLEDAHLVTRNENQAEVFPSSLLVGSRDEAGLRLKKLNPVYRKQLLDIIDKLINADPDQGISTDELMSVSGLSRDGVRHALYDFEQLGIATNDTTLTAYVHAGVKGESKRRLDWARELEVALVERLQEEAPDLRPGEPHSALQLRAVTQALKDAGHQGALSVRVQRLLRSISMDGRGDDGPGSIDLRVQDRETVHVKLNRDWRQLAETADRRRAAAGVLLEHLLNQLPPGARGADLLAETTLGKLLAAINADLMLRSRAKDPRKLLDRALLWLHEQEVIRLNKGMAVFRPAMTISLARTGRRFANADFAPLELHYQEQTLQIHVMEEFVMRGLSAVADAVRLAMDYFALERDEFLERWLPERKDLARQTTPDSWRAIVESLNNPVQRRLVADNREQTNMLVLAGPGSGKTRVLVHRIAYLLRVRREDPRGILALAYNRHAAVEIRRRLKELVGDDAHGTTVLTCHGLALRLTGTILVNRQDLSEDDFRSVLREAVKLLRGEGLPPKEADAQREQLLAGFRWILVDEYQDVDKDQYELISAVAGRTLTDSQRKLTLFAVGDDDQNIYGYAGASVKYIRRFEEDYDAKPAFLTQNYRSSAHIITAANDWIRPARVRMKVEHPIVIDRKRAKKPLGGQWQQLDPVAQGRVQIIRVPPDERRQALAALAEFKRLQALVPSWHWRTCAVIARNWRTLDPLRSLCELEGIPFQVAREDSSYFWRLRETRNLRDWLAGLNGGLVTHTALDTWLATQLDGAWCDVLREAIDDHAVESGGADVSARAFELWLAEWGRDLRRRQTGLLLLSAHRAKGLEFDHVVILDGGWDNGEPLDTMRRLYYVAMTRARETLTLIRTNAAQSMDGLEVRDAPIGGLDAGGSFWRRANASIAHRGNIDLPEPSPELDRRFQRLELRDVDLGFAGRHSAKHPVHAAIATLRPGDALEIHASANGWEVRDAANRLVGNLAKRFQAPAGGCRRARVHAVVTWSREDSEPDFRAGYRCDQWEVVVPELVFEPDRVATV